MQFVFYAAVVLGLAGIIYTACGLVRLNEYFNEVYGYDRDPYS